MKLFLFMYVLSLSVGAATKQEIQEAKTSLQALIRPIMQGSSNKKTRSIGKFTVENCEKYKIDWIGVLLMRTTATLNYTFKPGCDVEGTISPAIIKPFPMKLKLRHLENYSLIETQNKITSTLEAKPVLLLELRSGELTGSKGKVLFEADYRARINPMNKAKTLEENLGGELRITEIFGQKVSIKEKIYVE